MFLPRTFIPAVETAPYTAGNGALNDRKRWFTALIFTLFHRNPSVRITTAVSGRFSPVYSRLRAVLLDLGHLSHLFSYILYSIWNKKTAVIY
jgi:hypothetical protein